MWIELRKHIHTKEILCFILLLIINAFVFYQQILYEESELLSSYSTYINFIENHTKKNFHHNTNHVYLQDVDLQNDIYSSKALLRYQNQLRYINLYPDYIQSFPEKAEDAYHLSNKELSKFAQNSINKTVKDFANLEELDLTLGIDMQATKTFNNSFSNILLIAITIYMAMQHFNLEYNAKIYNLLLANKSRCKIAINKISSLMFICFVSTISIFGINFLISGEIFAYDDLGRLVQSIREFRTLHIPMTVGQFLLLAISIQFINTFAIAILSLCLYSIFKNSGLVITFYVIILSISYLTYTNIPINSTYSHLHYVNPIFCFNTFNLIRTYKNINIFTLPINLICLWLIIVVGIIIISALIIISQFKTARIIINNYYFYRVKAFISKLNTEVDKLNYRGNIFINEFRITLFTDKALLIILLLILLLFNKPYNNYKFQNTNRDIYSYYVDLFKDEISDKTLDDIEMAKSKIKNSNMEYILKEMELSILDKVENQVNNILQVKDNKKIKPILLDEYSYRYWINNEEYDYQDSLIIMLFTILATAGIFAKDNAIEANNLLRATKKYNKLINSKVIIIITIALFNTIFVLIKRYKNFVTFDKFSDLDAAIQNLNGWYDSNLQITIGQYLLISLIIKFIGVIILGLSISAISAWSANKNQAIIISIILMLLPLCGVIVGINSFKYFTISWLLEGTILVNNFMPIVLWAMFFVSMLIAICVTMIRGKKRPT